MCLALTFSVEAVYTEHILKIRLPAADLHGT